jgi:flavin-dependent dehydrogenase
MYDFLIIGARVSGAATARLLAEHGARVLLIDLATFPSDTTSTHMLQPKALAYLYRWGLIDHFKGHIPTLKSFQFTQEGLTFEATPSVADLAACLERDHGWSTAADGSTIPVEWMAIRRDFLDMQIINAAVKAGAELHSHALVESFIREDNRIAGVVLVDADGHKEEVRGRHIVVANGRNSALMDDLQSKILLRNIRGEFCFYNYFQDMDSHSLKTPLHLRSRYGLAHAPTNDNLQLVSVWGPAEYAKEFQSNLEENYYSVVRLCYPELAEQLQRDKKTGPFKGLLNITGIHREVVGSNWIAVGDAGYSLSQTTAIGITNAFRDAELAGYHLGNVYAGRCSFVDGAEQYRKQHNRDAEAYFHLIAKNSECHLPTVEELTLVYALQKNPEAAQRFLATVARILPVEAFFTPENIRSVCATISKEELQNVPAIRDFAAIAAKYASQKPWEK